MSMFKNWAVRQVASALSDYVEGIEPQTVETSLGLETGRLELRGARVNAKAVEKLGLQLVSSELTVDALIPWRHLSTEATVLSVSKLRLELRLQSSKVADGARESREAKEAKVKQLENELDTKASGEDASGGQEGLLTGRVARASHAILRQLQVKLSSLEALIHHELPRKASVTIALGESRLESVGSDWVSLPAGEESDLRKVLRFSGFELRMGGPAQRGDLTCGQDDLQLFGPLALEARFLHAPDRALARLWLRLPQESDAAIRISPDALQHLRSWFDWGMAEVERRSDTAGRELSEAAGRNYAAIYLRKLRGENFEDAILSQVERAASAEWLAYWRFQCRRYLKADKASSASKEKKRSYWLQYMSWATSTDAEVGPQQARQQDTSGSTMEAFLEDVGEAGLLPELTTPTRFRVDMLVPKLAMRCDGSDHCAEATAGSAAGSIDISASQVALDSGVSTLLRRVCIQLKLSSLLFRLDRWPLLKLQGRSADHASHAEGAEWREDNPPDFEEVLRPDAAGLQLRLFADQRLRASDASAAKPWNLSVSLLGEPVHIQLAPQSLHGAFLTAIEALHAWGSAESEGSTPPAAVDPELEDVLNTAAYAFDDSDEDLIKTVGGAHAEYEDSLDIVAAAGLADEGTLLRLDVDVKAPIVRLEAWRGRALELHLGRFLGKTSNRKLLTKPDTGEDVTNAKASSKWIEPLLKGDAEPVPLTALSFACVLRQTCIKITEPNEIDRLVYQPSTLHLHAALVAGAVPGSLCAEVRGEAGCVCCHMDPGILNLLGQLKVGVDYALAPLSLTSQTIQAAGKGSDRSTPGASSASWGVAFRMELEAESFQAIWDPSGGNGYHVASVAGKVGGARVTFEKSCNGDMSIVGDVKQVLLKGGSWEVFRCLGNLDVRANWSHKAVRLNFAAPPVELRWAAGPVKHVMAAAAALQSNVAAGEAEAGRLLVTMKDTSPTAAPEHRRSAMVPLDEVEEIKTGTEASQLDSEDLGASQVLWRRFVKQRAQQLRGTTWGQAFTDLAGSLGPADEGEGASSSPMSLEVVLCCQELRASLLRRAPGAGDVEEIRATVLGLECNLQKVKTVTLSASLKGLELWLESRLLLAPRHDNLPLLQLNLVQLEPATSLGRTRSHHKLAVTWAQVAMVYRQRDFDHVVKLIQTEIVGGISDSAVGTSESTPCKKPETSAETAPETDTSAARGSDRSLHYRFQVDAPLLFLPDSSGERCPSRSNGSEESAVGGLCWVGDADSDSRQRALWPLPGEGFAVLDLGQCSVIADTLGAKDAPTEVSLQRLQVFSAEPDDQKWHEVIRPVSAKVEMRSTADCLDIQVLVPLSQGSETRPSISLTRAQATQWFDILFLNLSYSSESGPPALPEVRERLKEQIAASSAGRGFRFKLAWEGPLVLDAGFTEHAQLARLEMDNGCFEFCRAPAAAGKETGDKTIEFCCQSGCVRDSRQLKQLAEGGMLIELPPPRPDVATNSFKVVAKFPADEAAPSQISVDLLQPNLWMLPMLWMDLLTWALSIYQQTAQAKADPQPADSSGSASSRAQAVKVDIREAAVRFPLRWAMPEEHVALSGDVFISFVSYSTSMRFERFALPNGRLLRTSAARGLPDSFPGRERTRVETVLLNSAESRVLCPHVQCFLSFDSKKSECSSGGQRTSTYKFDILQLKRFQLQLTLQDTLELAEALTSLTNMEGDSIEPEAEIRRRDPLALVTRQRLCVTGSIEIDGVEVQILHSSLKQRMRPVVELELGCPLLLLSTTYMRGEAPKASLRLENFLVSLSSLNERLDAWEPVLAPSTWSLDFLTRPSDSCPTEAVLEVHARPSANLQLVVAVPFIHLSARLLQGLRDAVSAKEAVGRKKSKESMQTLPVEGHLTSLSESIDDLVVAVNLTGLPCIAFRSDDCSSDVAILEAKAVGLDSVLGDGGSVVRLQLQLLDLPCFEVHVQVGAVYSWQTKVGTILVRVLVPQPPQLVLVLSSSVMLVNRTPVDLEVRLPVPQDAMSGPWPPFCIPSCLLEAQTKEQGATGAAPSLASGRSSLALPAGFLLSVPPQAVDRAASAEFQLRPSPGAVGVEYAWGEPIRSPALTSPLGVDAESVSFSSRSLPVDKQLDLPTYGFRVTSDREASGITLSSCCQLTVEAPFYLCNACPVDLYCDIRWQAKEGVQEIQEHKSTCDADATVYIQDGFGGVWEVPSNGSMFVAPISLNNDHFFWWPEGSHRESSRPCPPDMDALQVVRQGRRIVWHCCRTKRGGGKRSEQSIRLAPGKELPIFEMPASAGRNTPLLLAVALRDQHQAAMSLWSHIIPVSAAGTLSSVPLDLGSNVRLRCQRQPECCRAIIFGNCWFNNATGLKLALVRGQRRHPLLPVFGSLVIADDYGVDASSEEASEEAVSPFSLVIPGMSSTVPLPVVSLGQSTKLKLSKSYPCVLKTELMALSSTFGVNSTLVTMMPGLLAFNQLEGCELGVRQEGCEESVLWLAPETGSEAIFWSRADRPRRLQVAVRSSAKAVEPEAWSAAFEVSEQGVGAFPIVMNLGSNFKKMCIQVNQCAGQQMTVTAAGEDACHQLVNRHPCLMLDACFAGLESSIDVASHFVVPYGEQVAFGYPGSMPGHSGLPSGGELLLMLGDVKNAQEATTVRLRLDRASYSVFKPSEALPEVAVRVDLCERVTKITVSPVGFLGSGVTTGPDAQAGAAVTWALEVDLRVQSLAVSFVSNRPSRPEVFRCEVAGLAVVCNQSSDGQRETLCEFSSLQVDHHGSTRGKGRNALSSVILASLATRRALRLRILRVNLADSCDVVLRSVHLDFFPGADKDSVFLELSASEALLAEMKHFALEATPPQLEGPSLPDAAAQAGMPHHLVLHRPPLPALKYILHDVRIGDMRVGVWCSLSMGNLPGFAGAMLTISSVSTTIEVNGARVNLPQQSFFKGGRPFEGTLEGLSTVLANRYRPCISASWKSLLNNSNAMFGGLFGRYTWAPRQRHVTTAKPPILRSRSDGVICLREGDSVGGPSKAQATPPTDLASFLAADPRSRSSSSTATMTTSSIGSSASLDESGYHEVLASGKASELKVFLRRLTEMLGGKVTDESALSAFAMECFKSGSRSLDAAVEQLTSASWVS